MQVSESLSPYYHGPEGSQAAISRPSGSGSSGLKLVLPALKNLKPVKAGKKAKRNGSATQAEHGLQEEERKAPRPVKLKPLKEVLTKLIAQIKKKDDYAFFLKPVDIAHTPGYSDIVKRPMDFGTMTVKVNKGKYRSLEEFASDLRLVTSNAKLFNPPGTIYYTEAEKIEAWGLDHIAKAASTVIQYETDWNIEIEKDEEGHNINIDDDDDDLNVGTPMDVDDSGLGARSPSVASEIRPGTQRRGVRGPYKKNNTTTTTTSNTLTETVDAEGRLPGSREGLAAFPPGSDWAKTMVALKLKGKRYKTKKERMRVEKEGPPLLADGSLDYTEMEDPFSVLSALAPDPLSRPYLAPLHPPLFRPVDITYDPSSSRSQPPQPPTSYPTSINLPLDHSFPAIPIPPATSAPSVSKQRRHWVITRNVARKARDREDDQEPPDVPSWKNPREAHATDFGSFAFLAGAIEDELRRRQVTGHEGEEEEKLLETIRESLDPDASAVNPPTSDHCAGKAEYWSTERSADAEGYIRDVVYGGVAGLAYVRSLAEFATVKQRQEPGPGSDSGSGLGMPLATWVEKNLVDSLTNGRHTLLRETAQELIIQRTQSLDRVKQETLLEDVSAQVTKSLHVYPPATVALSALRQISTHKVDMGALIKTPEELFLSEEEWFGKIFRERRKPRGEEPRKAAEEFEVEEPEKTWMDINASAKDVNGTSQDSDYELEGPEELNQVLDYVAGVIVSLDRTIRDQRPSSTPVTKGMVQEFRGISTSSKALGSDFEGQERAEDGKGDIADRDGTLSVSDALEVPVLRNLRLNLLALAKRAPLDTIARLPKDLVPEHIRHFVPTLGVSG